MRPQLLIMGDSITEFGSQYWNDGYVSLLLNRFNRSADICQRGMGGYTTQSFMNLVIETMRHDIGTTLHPDLITLWLGANDAALPDGPSKGQHVTLEKYKSNLHALVAMFKDRAPQAKILLITPPAVDDDKRRDLNKGVLDRSNAAAGQYAKACCEVAQETGVQSLDLHTSFNAMPPAEWKALLIDGLHLSKKGNEVMEKQLVDAITKNYPDLDKKLQTWEFPAWHEEPPAPAPASALDAPVALLKWFFG